MRVSNLLYLSTTKIKAKITDKNYLDITKKLQPAFNADFKTNESTNS